MRLPDLEAWAIFAAVVEHRSFSAAADAIGLSKATVSKAVTRLEAQLGQSLFHRTSRRLALTEAGKPLAEHAARIVGEARAAEDAARDGAVAPTGRIRLARPDELRCHQRRAAARAFSRRSPGHRDRSQPVGRARRYRRGGVRHRSADCEPARQFAARAAALLNGRAYRRRAHLSGEGWHAPAIPANSARINSSAIRTSPARGASVIATGPR